MKQGGLFSRFLETMGIMVNETEDNAYEATEGYDNYEQSQDEPEKTFDQSFDEQAFETPISEIFAQQEAAEEERTMRTAAVDNTYKSRETRAQKGNVINMHNQSAAQAQPMRPQAAPSMSVLVYRPSSFEDTQKIIDNVKAQRPVIVNLDALDVEEAQRSLDFISGASYALNGKVFKVAVSIFVLAPYNIDITGNIQNEMYPEADDEYYDETMR